MTQKDRNIFSLERAKETILAAIHPLPVQVVGLNEAQQRITASDVPAAISLPSYDESTRDGFVIRVIDGSGQTGGQYQVVHEIPAGKPSEEILLPGTACRIMTGGCVPEGSTRVVPFEDCVERDGVVTIAPDSLSTRTTFIRKIGSEIRQGERLISAGVTLQAAHLALLASCGIQDVSVIGRPSVGYVCTGSELISGAEILENGQKVSSNSFLLRGLITSAGGCPANMGIIRDNARDLLALFAKVITDAQLSAMITTGGMGPGKYDLVERVFVEAGGKVVFNAIAMRPGKAFLFGTLGRTLFFGLPGPPHAVRTLLNELVGPALLAMQGQKGEWPKKVRGYLQHALSIKRSDVFQLKDGMLTVEDGACSVRSTDRLEMGNCFMVLPPGKNHYPEGDPVEVHLALDR